MGGYLMLTVVEASARVRLVVLAASSKVIALAVVFYALAYPVPLYLARRIGKPKGYRWFWWGFWLGWIGVLILVRKPPKPWTAIDMGAYHVPPGVAAQGRGLRNNPLYSQRRR